jgi:AbrB family looped-hinge helix DNA binding protein
MYVRQGAMYKSATLQPRGQITLPKGVREAVKIKPGDRVHFSVPDSETIVLKVIPRMTLAEMIERYASNEPYDEERIREAWQAEAADHEMRHTLEQ